MRQEVISGHSVLHQSRHTPLKTLKAMTRCHDQQADSFLGNEKCKQLRLRSLLLPLFDSYRSRGPRPLEPSSHQSTWHHTRTSTKKSLWRREHWLYVACRYLTKGKFVSVQTIKAYTGSGGTIPFILNLGTRWRWVVNITLRPLYLQDRTPVPTV